MDVSSVVTYISLVCDPVGGVGFLPAPVLEHRNIGVRDGNQIHGPPCKGGHRDPTAPRQL
jgi:hypothetical protein